VIAPTAIYEYDIDPLGAAQGVAVVNLTEDMEGAGIDPADQFTGTPEELIEHVAACGYRRLLTDHAPLLAAREHGEARGVVVESDGSRCPYETAEECDRRAGCPEHDPTTGRRRSA
jgi:hypothetical protein